MKVLQINREAAHEVCVDELEREDAQEVTPSDDEICAKCGGLLTGEPEVEEA